MADMDLRVVKVGVEIGDRLQVYDGLYVKATGSKFANATQNEATITIANLSAEVRNYLATETSPYNRNKVRKRVLLWCGRQSSGTFLLFAGDIISATPSQPPDIALTIKAKTGQYDKGTIVGTSLGAVTPLSVVSRSVAQQLGLNLVFEALEKNISNWSFSGAAAKLVDELSQTGMVNAFVDDNTLVVKNFNEPLKSVSSVLSQATGMIGMPEVNEQGVKVKMLMTPGVAIGGRLTLNSKYNPAANGDYTIYKLSFDIASRDQAYYWIIEAKRPGVPLGEPRP